MQTKKLKFVLKANAVFSTCSGLAMLLFSTSISRWMGIQQANILTIIGIGLLCFAFSIFQIIRQAIPTPKLVKAIIWQDWIWVIGSIGIITTQAFDLHLTGYILIGIIALIVADFAILQQRYL